MRNAFENALTTSLVACGGPCASATLHSHHELGTKAQHGYSATTGSLVNLVWGQRSQMELNALWGAYLELRN